MIHPRLSIPRPVAVIAVSLTALVSCLATSAAASAAVVTDTAASGADQMDSSVAIPAAASILGLPAVTLYWMVAGVLVTWAGLVLASRSGRRGPGRIAHRMDGNPTSDMTGELPLPSGMV